MKNLLVIGMFLTVISCNSKKEDEVDGSNANQPGVLNVNGNMPDTTNSINIDNNKTDSATAGRDSIKK